MCVCVGGGGVRVSQCVCVCRVVQFEVQSKVQVCELSQTFTN